MEKRELTFREEILLRTVSLGCVVRNVQGIQNYGDMFYTINDSSE